MSKQAERVQIEIGGHKGRIDSVNSQVGDGVFRPREDRLIVYIAFDQAVDGILGFPVFLPVEPYGKEGLLEAVKREGEKSLEVTLRRNRAERAKRAQQEEKQRDLDGIAASVRAAIGLE